MKNSSNTTTNPKNSANAQATRASGPAASSIQVVTGPAIRGLCYFTTLRHHGLSEGSKASLNFGYHVNDDPEAVRQNRQRLSQLIGREIVWMEQTHSTLVADIDPHATEQPEIRRNDRNEPNADALLTSSPNHALAIMTADCLPIVLATPDAEVIAAVHAGWRGLAGGILTKTLEQMRRKIGTTAAFAWIGPAISQDVFEVGSEVVEQFSALDPTFKRFFRPADPATDLHIRAPWASAQRADMTSLQCRLKSLPQKRGHRPLEKLLHGCDTASGNMSPRTWASDAHSAQAPANSQTMRATPHSPVYSQPKNRHQPADPQQKFYGDLSAIARQILQQEGVQIVIDSGLCSYRRPDMLFSYRKDPKTGRMATIVCKSRPATHNY